MRSKKKKRGGLSRKKTGTHIQRKANENIQSMIYLRKEWFGGIIGDPKTYNLYLVNRKAYQEIIGNCQNGAKVSSSLKTQLRDREIRLDSGCAVIDNKDTQSGAIVSAPVILWLEITDQCSCNCIHCFRDTKQNGNSLSTGKILEIIDESQEMGVFKISILLLMLLAVKEAVSTRPTGSRLTKRFMIRHWITMTIESQWRNDNCFPIACSSAPAMQWISPFFIGEKS